MTVDPVRNFLKITVPGLYLAADTSITLNTGDGAKLPSPSTEGAFNLIWYNDTDYPDPSDDPYREIVRVTAETGDTITVTRAQEGTTATDKNSVGKTYKLILSMTKKTIDDIRSTIAPIFRQIAVTGTQDGSNLIFALGHAPITTGAYFFYSNGQKQIATDFSVSGTTLTVILSATMSAPLSTDVLEFYGSY